MPRSIGTRRAVVNTISEVFYKAAKLLRRESLFRLPTEHQYSSPIAVAESQRLARRPAQPHSPSTAKTERSLTQNRASALALLRARLWEKENDLVVGQRTNQRRQQVGSGMRGDKRRTIRADGVVDHITGQRWEFKQYSRGDW